MRFLFRLLTPIMFFLAVIAYLGDFRLVSIAIGAFGCICYLIAEELNASG